MRNALRTCPLVLVIVAWAAFCMFQFVGDPVQQMIGQDTSPEDVQRMRANLEAPSKELADVEKRRKREAREAREPREHSESPEA